MKRPKPIRTTVPGAPRTEERDGKLWLYLGKGPFVEPVAAAFCAEFPEAQQDVDIWDDIWVWDERMAADSYAHLGIKVSVEWFRRT